MLAYSHVQVGGLFSQLEGEGRRVRELHKIVLSTRSRQQLGLDQKVRLANTWDQVAKPLLIQVGNLNVGSFPGVRTSERVGVWVWGRDILEFGGKRGVCCSASPY